MNHFLVQSAVLALLLAKHLRCMEVAAISWEDGRGTALFLSFLHASLYHPWDQKGDLLAQRGGKQGEVSDLSRTV